MLVTVNDVRVVGPGQQEFGEIYVTTKPDELRTPRGGTYIEGLRRDAHRPSADPAGQPPGPRRQRGRRSRRGHDGAGRLVHLRRLCRRGHHCRQYVDNATSSRPRRPRRLTNWPSRPTTSRTSTPPTPPTSSRGWPRCRDQPGLPRCRGPGGDPGQQRSHQQRGRRRRRDVEPGSPQPSPPPADAPTSGSRSTR